MANTIVGGVPKLILIEKMQKLIEDAAFEDLLSEKEVPTAVKVYSRAANIQSRAANDGSLDPRTTHARAAQGHAQAARMAHAHNLPKLAKFHTDKAQHHVNIAKQHPEVEKPSTRRPKVKDYGAPPNADTGAHTVSKPIPND